MVITIDGPAGSGKSTVARKLANRLGFIHLNSGALFRAVGISASKQGIPLDDDFAVQKVARELTFLFSLDEQKNTVFLVDGKNISREISEEHVGKLASQVALLPSVREELLNIQRQASKKHSLVVEGRDSGTVVFPDAEKKFYLDAGLDVRAKRRQGEFGELHSLEEVKKQIESRDLQDSTRKIAPQIVPPGATVIDTSELGVDDVIERMFQEVSIG